MEPVLRQPVLTIRRLPRRQQLGRLELLTMVRNQQLVKQLMELNPMELEYPIIQRLRRIQPLEPANKPVGTNFMELVQLTIRFPVR